MAVASVTPIGLALVLAAQSAPTHEARPISYGVGIDVRSGYADRGFVISDGPVVQPVAWVSGSVVSFWVWSNFTLAETTDSSLPQVGEMELTLAHEWGRFTIGPAIRTFVYHDPVSPYSTRSIEGWLYLWYDVGPFRLFTNHSIDVLTYRGAYFGSAGIEVERRVSPRLTAGGTFSGGWASATFNDAYAGVARSAFNGISVEGRLTAEVMPHWSIGPVFAFSTTMDRRVRAGLARPSFVFVGVTTGVEF